MLTPINSMMIDNRIERIYRRGRRERGHIRNWIANKRISSMPVLKRVTQSSNTARHASTYKWFHNIGSRRIKVYVMNFAPFQLLQSQYRGEVCKFHLIEQERRFWVRYHALDYQSDDYWSYQFWGFLDGQGDDAQDVFDRLS